MTKKRPVGVTVFAVLSLVFGGLGMICMMCGAISLAATPALQKMQEQQQQQLQPQGKAPFDPQGMQKYMEANVPGFIAVQWGSMAVGLVLSTVLIVAGIGLLGMKPWARGLAIVYCVITIIVQLASLAYNIAVVNPAQNEWIATQGVNLPTGILPALSVFGTMLGITFAVAMFIYMVLPGTARAFAVDGQQALGTGQSDEYYDPDFERKRRELPPED